jgi:hypothetical protein
VHGSVKKEEWYIHRKQKAGFDHQLTANRLHKCSILVRNRFSGNAIKPRLLKFFWADFNEQAGGSRMKCLLEMEAIWQLQQAKCASCRVV